MEYTTSRAYALNEQTQTYQKSYPITHQSAVFTKDDETETLDVALTNINTNITINTNTIGNLTTNGLTEIDLATAIKNDRSQMSDMTNSFKNGDFTNHFDTQYKGSEIYFPYANATYGTYQSIIDKLVLDGCTAIAICPKLNMVNKTDNVLTRIASDNDIIGVFAYAKSKGLKTMLKCHYYGAVSSQYDITPTDTPTWIQSWANNVMYYVNLVSNNLDGVCLANEAVNQTNGNASLWQTLNSNIKAVNNNIFTVSASTKSELSSSVLFDIVDFIGCNLYISIGGSSANTVNDLKPNMYRDVNDDIDWITTLLDISKQKNKKIMITEVGCLPYESSLANSAGWQGQGATSQGAQDLYYKITLSTFLNASNIIGIFIWNACDGFTFIGNTAENTVRTLFGGGN